MKRISQITIVALLVSCGLARAGMVLLATHDAQVGGGVAPQDEMRVQFVLEIFAQDSFPPGPRLGTGIFWRDGDSGTVDFAPQTDPDFLSLAVLATNGVNDDYRIHTNWPDGAGGGGGGFESRLFGRSPHAGEPPDLVGYELELIRLTVENVGFEPWPGDDGDGYFVLADLRYEFFGSVIPEPATLVLLVGGIAYLVPSRLRRFRTRTNRMLLGQGGGK